MALRNPLDVLGFGAPRQGGFGGPAVPMAPPMPGPGFAPVTGPGGSGNVLPARYGRLDRFQQNHPRASGFLADNSSALLHFGLGLLSGGGVPSRSWQGAQQGLYAGGQIDRERQATKRAEDEKAAQDAEWEAILAELPMGEDERRVLRMVGPEAGAEAVFNMLSAQPEGPEFGPIITGEQALAMGLDPSKAYQQEANGEWHQIGGGGVNVTVPVAVGGEPEFGTIPAGYARVPDPESPTGYRLVVEPGGEAEANIQRFNEGAAREAEAQLARSQIVVDDINQALAMLDNPLLAGWSGQRLLELGITPAVDLAGLLSTITSSIGIERIIEMKDASPNGATGFGALNETELRLLLAQLGSLDQAQSATQLRRNLERILPLYMGILEDMQAEIGIEPSPSAAPSDPASAPAPSGGVQWIWDEETQTLVPAGGQ